MKTLTLHCKDFMVLQYPNGTSQLRIVELRESDIQKINNWIRALGPRTIRIYTADHPKSLPYVSESVQYFKSVKHAKKSSFLFTTTDPKKAARWLLLES